MSITAEIHAALSNALQPSHLEIINESAQHQAHPAMQARSNLPQQSLAETHLRLIIVSDAFQELTLVKRHQRVYALLNRWINNPIHALTLLLFTEDEWQKNSSQANAH